MNCMYDGLKLDTPMDSFLKLHWELAKKKKKMPHANAWIRALPIHQNKFSSLQWSISMKKWLGIPFFNQDALCPASQIQVMDIFGHHACVCPVKRDRIKRHNIIRDILLDFCSTAAWAPVKEKAFLFAGSSERPADIFIPNFLWERSLF